VQHPLHPRIVQHFIFPPHYWFGVFQLDGNKYPLSNFVFPKKNIFLFVSVPIFSQYTMLSYFVYENENAMTQWLLSLQKQNASMTSLKTLTDVKKQKEEEDFVFV
jgi:hypothetical protein